jgi:perosamine synthetase
MTTRDGDIPNAVPHLAGNEWTYVKQCLDDNWVSTAGPWVERFERAVAAYVGAPHAVATVNGTAALHVALLAAGVKPGDEVLVPTFTFIATASAVVHAGAHPVFMDAEPRSLGIDPEKLRDFLERECEVRAGTVIDRATGRVIRALLPVHLYGHPCDLDALLEIGARYPLAMVEDAAEALGARYKGRPVGAHGQLSCLSFNGNKIITTGGGGMVLTHDEALATRVRRLTTQSRTDPIEFVHDEAAYNYRLTSIQAALGLAQMEQLDGFVEDKRATARHYATALSRVDGVEPMAEPLWSHSTFWMATALLDPARYPDVRGLIGAANREGLGLRPFWHPLHCQAPFAGSRSYRIEVADRLHARGVCLPCSVGITPDERERVVAWVAAAAR